MKTKTKTLTQIIVNLIVGFFSPSPQRRGSDRLTNSPSPSGRGWTMNNCWLGLNWGEGWDRLL